ncbi:MAG: insulinase family protein [Phycisphaerae bacterium]|jgi:zinc protease
MLRSTLTNVVRLSVLLFAAQCLAQEKLPTDSRVQTGRLDNGVSWVYRQHATPPGRVFLLVHVRTGSLNETEAQRGLAHFIEHMGFNGTEHFAPGELIPYFESIGMEFGADVNAYTSFDQTCYMVFLPDTSMEEIDKGLMVLSDYVFRDLLLEAEIDKERGVILEELRGGQRAEQRMRDELWPKLFAGSRFGQRMVIGTEEVIRGAGRDELERYYRTWYRPENVTVFLVGDVELDPLMSVVQKWFGEYKPEGPAEKAHGPEFKPFTEQRAIIVTDPEYARGDFAAINLRPGRQPPTTVDEWRGELVEHLACRMVTRRLEERVRQGEASFQEAGLWAGSFFDEAVLVSAQASGEPRDWEAAAREVVIEISRARQFGFNERELELARSELRAAAQRAVDTENTRDGQAILFELSRLWHEQQPIMTAAQELELVDRLLPTITLAELNQVFADYFRPGTFAYVLEFPDKPDVKVPTEDEVLAVARAALSERVEPPVEKKGPGDLLAAEPEAGHVVESTVDEDLGITSAWLENGVRFHHRYMDYRKDTVLMSISLAGGQIEETPDNIGVTAVSLLAINQPATSRLSSNDVIDIMTGKNVEVRAVPAEDAVVIRIQGSPADLEDGLRLVYALLQDAKLEEAAFTTWKQSLLQRLAMAQQRPDFKGFEAMRELMGGGDPRLAMPTAERVERQTVAGGQAWIERLCKQAPIEVAIVGDIKLDRAQSLIEKYLGSLAPRERTAANLDPLRKLHRQAGPLKRRVEVPTVTDKAFFLYGFMSCDAVAVEESRLFHLAANIVTSRLIKRVREELSLVYTIQAQSEPSMAYLDNGLFFSYSPCDPAKIDEVVAETERVYREFAEKGPTDEELANARKQVETDLDTDMKEPEYWWGVLQGLEQHKMELAPLKTIRADFAGYTAEQVRAAFAKYYTPERTFVVTAAPVPPPAPPAPVEPAEAPQEVEEAPTP